MHGPVAVCFIFLYIQFAVANFESRIVNGDDASIKELPYQVQILNRENLHCGGSIVTKTHVVSAAHCFSPGNIRSIRKYSIRAGTNIFKKGAGHTYKISNFTVHPKYDNRITDYDAAVLKINGRFDGNNMKPIPLSDASLDSVIGHEAIVSGYGFITFNGPASKKLQKIHVPLISEEQCTKTMSPLTITSRMVCAGYTNGKSDACIGDSGGPLALEGELIGIVSWGIGCATEGRYGVYTYVPTIREWLEQTISEM